MNKDALDIFISAMEMFTIAVEAPVDLTTKVDEDASNIMGNNSKNSNTDINTNTDDILKGGDPTLDKNQKEDVDDNRVPEEDSDTAEDENTEEMPDGSNDSEDGAEDDSEMGDDEDVSDTTDAASSNDPAYNKNRLRDSYLYFKDIISNNIDLLNDYNEESNDQELHSRLCIIKDTLLKCQNNLYDILTKEFDKTDYEVLMRKYIALKQIHEISCNMLEAYAKERESVIKKNVSNKKLQHIN